jgi:uncharacterized protein YegP (UPF0339 family)
MPVYGFCLPRGDFPKKVEGIMPKFEIFQSKNQEYRWRLRADNGRVIADSGEGYTSKSGCENGIESVKKNAPIATVEEMKE